MLNRKPSSTVIHTHTIILRSNHGNAVVPGQDGRSGSLAHFVFILTFGPIEIKATDLTCALVLAICIIMLLIFDILP